MEREYLFKVYYDKVFVLDVFAHTKWEAIDKAYFKYLYLNLNRSRFSAKK